MNQYNTIAESKNFIVLDEYAKYSMVSEPPVGYQTEFAPRTRAYTRPNQSRL